MHKKIYNATVQVAGGLEAVLKKCFLTHLTIYNYSLEQLKEHPRVTYQELRESVFQYVEKNQIPHLHIQIVQNEIYYQYKKFKKSNSGQKLLSSIQYFTLIVKDFNNGIIQLDESRTQLRFTDRDGYLLLPEPLPVVTGGNTTLYLNLSYSAMENQFQLSVFSQTPR
jgi:hypothetical protein